MEIIPIHLRKEFTASNSKWVQWIPKIKPIICKICQLVILHRWIKFLDLEKLLKSYLLKTLPKWSNMKIMGVVEIELLQHSCTDLLPQVANLKTPILFKKVVHHLQVESTKTLTTSVKWILWPSSNFLDQLLQGLSPKINHLWWGVLQPSSKTSQFSSFRPTFNWKGNSVWKRLTVQKQTTLILKGGITIMGPKTSKGCL